MQQFSESSFLRHFKFQQYTTSCLTQTMQKKKKKKLIAQAGVIWSIIFINLRVLSTFV